MNNSWGFLNMRPGIIISVESSCSSDPQKKILKDFHTGHPGATRMKNLIRSYVYWRNIDKVIEEKVKACRGWALAAKVPPIQFSPWPKADYPWSRIHVDYTGPLDRQFLQVAGGLQV